MREDLEYYVDDVFKKWAHLYHYVIGLRPLNEPRMWPKSEGIPFNPPPYRIMPRRPKKIEGNMLMRNQE